MAEQDGEAADRELNGKVDKRLFRKLPWLPQQDSTLGCFLELVIPTRTYTNATQQTFVEHLLGPSHREEIKIGEVTMRRLYHPSREELRRV